MSTIEVTNIGPVEHARIGLPENGGIVVLKGRNGSGKTTTLKAVESAMTGRGRPEPTDGVEKGRVEALGVTISVGRQNRRSGELEVSSLEGKLSLAELIDPQVKDPEAADQRRIKALVALANPSVPELMGQLHNLLPGGRDEFLKVVRSGIETETDPVAAIEAVKRDIEAAARKLEDSKRSAEDEAIKLAPPREELADGESIDTTDLHKSLESAIKERESLLARNKRALEQQTTHNRARAKLEQLRTASIGDVAEIEGLHAKVVDELATHKAELDGLLKRVSEVESAMRDATVREKGLTDRLTKARDAAKELAELESVISEPEISEATTDELSAADKAMANAQARIERAAIVRRARDKEQQAETWRQRAKEDGKKADTLRGSAAKVEDLLSDLVREQGGTLTVNAGRLYHTDAHGKKHTFHRLSAGERARIAVEIGVSAVGERGVLVLPQEVWEGLDPVNRVELGDIARDHHVWLITAEASADEQVTSEVFNGHE